MTVKELIRNYLSGKGFVLTGDIHNYICSGGHSPFGTGPCLSRMRKSGELLSQGGGHKTAYRLNPDFVPEKSTVRPSAPKPKILQEWKEPMRQAEPGIERSFRELQE